MTANDTTKPPLDFASVRSMATGQWPGILSALGIEVSWTNRHQPCPGCGGCDRFRADNRDGRGTWICGQGGGEPLAGDGFALVQHVRGCGVVAAFEAVADVLGDTFVRERCLEPQRQPPKVERRDPGKRAYAASLWLQARRDDCTVAKHTYVQRKGFEAAHGAGVVPDVLCRQWEMPERCLIVPVRASGVRRVIAAQCITGDGRKVTFGSMTAVDGTPGYLLLGSDLDRACRVFVAEGWADIVSLVFLAYEGNACGAVAFGKGRLERVAHQVYADLGRVPVIVEDSAA